jgi:hypothetical protein
MQPLLTTDEETPGASGFRVGYADSMLYYDQDSVCIHRVSTLLPLNTRLDLPSDSEVGTRTIWESGANSRQASVALTLYPLEEEVQKIQYLFTVSCYHGILGVGACCNGAFRQSNRGTTQRTHSLLRTVFHCSGRRTHAVGHVAMGGIAHKGFLLVGHTLGDHFIDLAAVAERVRS